MATNAIENSEMFEDKIYHILQKIQAQEHEVLEDFLNLMNDRFGENVRQRLINRKYILDSIESEIFILRKEVQEKAPLLKNLRQDDL